MFWGVEYDIMAVMKAFLSHFFHNETNDKADGGQVHIPSDKALWPDAWKKVAYKQYALMRALPLPSVTGPFFDGVLQARRSSVGYILDNVLTIPTLAYVLRCGYGLQAVMEDNQRKGHRTVPSAGQRYPLEVYLILFRDIESLSSGIYHYGIREHALEPVAIRDFSQADILRLTPIKWLKDTQGMICITSVSDRMTDKYGNRGYRYILLEAGHAAQNMLLAGTERGINILPVGGVHEERVEAMIGLGGADERLVYTLFF